MKRLLFVLPIVFFFVACSGGGPSESNDNSEPPPKSMIQDKTPKSIKEGKGIGETISVELTNPLNQDWVSSGKAIYELKCAACHKLSDKRVVGPGWKGLTQIRKPEWIMNMITNVDIMLEEDPEAQKLLEECLTRMPNQNVTVKEAREILEFMRSNDGET